MARARDRYREESVETESSEVALERAFERTVREGEGRLTRTWLTLLATGMVGGIDVSVGVLALLLVERLTGNVVAAALAFGIGFLALTLANSELFTENFLVPIATLVAHRAGLPALIRLWAGTLLTNLLGGWVMMALITLALPELHPVAIGLGVRFFKEGIGMASFASALIGGAAITLMTWMQHNTTSVPAKMAAALAAAFLLAAGHLDHAIVASLEMFGALLAGAPYSYLDWLALLGWYVLGNVVGGIGLVTILRLGQIGVGPIREEQERIAAR